MNKLQITLMAVLCTVTLLFLTVACEDYKQASYLDMEDMGYEMYNGTILDYLSAGDEKLNVRFDSMMVLINGIPGFKETLQEAGAKYTVFAIPNECFTAAEIGLKKIRQSAELGKPIYLDSLLIEPFEVVDTVLPNESLEDTVYIIRKYDYRAMTDTLLNRYIFEGVYDSPQLDLMGGEASLESYKYGYIMSISGGRRAASGTLDGGVRYMFLSDTNNSKLTDKWVRSDVQWHDIYTTDGVVHVLSTGHEFGFDKFISRFKNYGNERKK